MANNGHTLCLLICILFEVTPSTTIPTASTPATTTTSATTSVPSPSSAILTIQAAEKGRRLGRRKREAATGYGLPEFIGIFAVGTTIGGATACFVYYVCCTCACLNVRSDDSEIPMSVVPSMFGESCVDPMDCGVFSPIPDFTGGYFENQDSQVWSQSGMPLVNIPSSSVDSPIQPVQYQPVPSDFRATVASHVSPQAQMPRRQRGSKLGMKFQKFMAKKRRYSDVSEISDTQSKLSHFTKKTSKAGGALDEKSESVESKPESLDRLSELSD